MLGTGTGPFGPPQAARWEDTAHESFSAAAAAFAASVVEREAAAAKLQAANEFLFASLRSLKVCWSRHVGVPCGDAAGAEAAAAAAAAAGWRVVSADFAADGSLLLVAAVGGPEGSSAKLLLIDLKTGCVPRVYDCPEGGVSSARFVALSTAECLIGGAEADACVRLWDLAAGRLVCPYPLPVPLIGSEGLLAHPRQRLFLASCCNGSVLLFDLKQSQPLAVMQCENPRPAIAFDWEGLVFAVARFSTDVRLVNSELTDLQEFSAFDLSASLDPGSCIASLCFSPDGEAIAVATNRHQLLLVNAFEGTTMARLCEASFGDLSSDWPCTPTFSGNSSLLFWSRGPSLLAFRMPPATDSGAQQQQKQQRQQQTDLNTELLVARHAGHSEPISIAKASPTHALVLTVGGGVVALWQPAVQA
ncbi:WD-40 repeat-containing protein, putative [Eimeria necatrix]|uniref:WD-40 repeat-containing protein, putative n=1 Tax=Eimeria necatrix TaxID=51315 RepID=U6MW18_9EIME|nr:WD-40 repeat-containing protein, putative [Eimeria necatrix]CDJ68151.1 WD-40 repeat-containing protein, putative [Eimeria necatrix]